MNVNNIKNNNNINIMNNIIDPADNSSVKELPRRFLAPPMATVLSTRVLLEPSLGTSKCNLQNTQTTPLATICTPTLKLGHKITNEK